MPSVMKGVVILSILGFIGIFSLSMFLLDNLWAIVIWSQNPEKFRIEYVGSFEKPEDFGLKAGFFEKIKNFIFGEKEEHRLLKPTGIYVGDDLYVITDQGLQGVLILDLNKKRIRYIGGFKSPIDVDYYQNRIYVSDSILGEIFVLNKDGKFITSFGKGYLKRPTGLVIDKKSKRILVTDTLSNRILIFGLDGKLKGKIEKDFSRPTYLSVDSSGKIYVSDSLNAKVRVFSPEGKEILSFGKRGNSIGTFANPRGIAVDDSGRIYVGDSLFSTIQIFDKNAKVLFVLGGYGNEKGSFAFPMDIYVYGKNIFVADSYNSRIVLFRYVGED